MRAGTGEPKIDMAGRSARNRHRLYLLVILSKGLLGLSQLAIAAGLYLGLQQNLAPLAEWLVRSELGDDPNDFFATHLMTLGDLATGPVPSFYLIYFTAHGLLHVAVVAALLWGAAWANHAAIGVLALFVVYQMAEWVTVGGVLLLVLSAIDLFVIAVTLMENRDRGEARA